MSTPLTHLRLHHCLVDEEAISAVLSFPKRLRHLYYCCTGKEHRWPGLVLPPNAKGELPIIQQLLLALARFQPHIPDLYLSVRNTDILRKPRFRGHLDFSGVPGVRDLHLREAAFAQYKISPVNVLSKLPIGIERLEIITSLFDVQDWARRLLDIDNSIPASLREAHFQVISALNLPKALGPADQQDDKLHGFDMILNEPIPSLSLFTYTT